MTEQLTRTEIRRWTQVGVLVSLALIFGYIETLIAIPIPGVRLGLANVVVLVALKTLPLGQAAGIALLKVVVSGLLFGSPLTIAYASLGTLLSFCVTAVLARAHRISVVAISACGALLHTLGQLLVAEWLLGTSAVWAWSPLLAATSLVAGIITGVVAQSTLEAFERADGVDSDAPFSHEDLTSVAASVLDESATRPSGASAAARLVALVALVALLFQTRDLTVMLVVTALSAALALAAKVPRQALRRSLPLAILALATATLQLALGQPVAAAATTVLRLVCPVLLCMSFIHATSLAELRALTDGLLTPLSRRWHGAEGLALALSVAFAFLPLEQHLLDELRLREGNLSPSLLAKLIGASLGCTDRLAELLVSGSPSA